MTLGRSHQRGYVSDARNRLDIECQAGRPYTRVACELVLNIAYLWYRLQHGCKREGGRTFVARIGGGGLGVAGLDVGVSEVVAESV